MKKFFLFATIFIFLSTYVHAGPIDNGPIGTCGITSGPVCSGPMGKNKLLGLFIFEAKTTASPETFTLPLEIGGTYNFNVLWGDGNSDHITAWNAAAVTHTYASAGTHTVSISGIIQGWRFNNGGDKLKIYDIKSWGPLRLGSNNGYFFGCSNLTVSATDILDLTNTTSLRYAFYNCSSLTTLDVSAWNIAAVTNCHSAFYGCTSLTALDVSAWDTANVTSWLYSFYNCTSLTVLDVSAWNTANTTTFGGTFRNCSSLTALNVSAWDTAAVTDLDSTFRGCSSLTVSGLDSWNVASVTAMTRLLQSVTLTTANYDALILSWSPQAQIIVANFHGGNSKYTGGGAVATARAAWVAKGWTITDGGIAP